MVNWSSETKLKYWFEWSIKCVVCTDFANFINYEWIKLDCRNRTPQVQRENSQIQKQLEQQHKREGGTLLFPMLCTVLGHVFWIVTRKPNFKQPLTAKSAHLTIWIFIHALHWHPSFLCIMTRNPNSGGI